MFATRISMASVKKQEDETPSPAWIWAFPTAGKSTLALKYPNMFFDPELTEEGKRLIVDWQSSHDDQTLEKGMREVILNQFDGRTVLTNWHRPQELGLEEDRRVGPRFIVDPETIKERFDRRNPDHGFSVDTLTQWYDGAVDQTPDHYILGRDEYLESALRSVLMDKITIPE